MIVLLNLFILATPFTQHAFDSETHLFFADHYRNGWFDPWEEKWFDGMWVFSYPPLTHQLIAIFSLPFGFEVGYKLVQALTLLALPVAMWVFAQEMVGRQYAGWAALLATVVPGVYVVLYNFGQLPTLLGIVLTLAGVGYLSRYIRSGEKTALLAWFLFAGVAASTHHHTVLTVMPALVGVLVIQHWIRRRKHLRWQEVILRPGIGTAALALAPIIAVFPFWWWFFTQNLPQTEIIHPTRMNFFRNDAKEAEMFFWGVYGGLLALVPFGLWAVVRRPTLWPMGILIAILGVLGLGTTITPLPKMLFQYHDLWRWLTYERFAFWAAVLSVVPISIWIKQVSISRYRYLIGVPVAILLLFGATREATFTLNKAVIAPPLERWEETEIVKFLEDDERSQWRYITFGLGEIEVARLSRLSSAQTVDGTYYTARRRIELRESGIGILDGSPWWIERSYDTLFPMLQRPWEWNLRWAITADRWVEQHLRNSGWQPVHPIGSDNSFQEGDPVYSTVWIWQVPYKTEIPPIGPSIVPAYPPYLPFLWGILPLTLLSLGIAVASWDAKTSRSNTD